MARATKPVLLVGGVPGETAEQVFRTVGPALGDLAIGLTDGEIGQRRFWVFFVAVNTWQTHPDLQMLRPVQQTVEGLPEWVAADYGCFQWYGAKDGVESLSPIESLGYPDEAAGSYTVFRRLRNEGVIPEGVRFQQSLPFPDDAVRLFTNNARDMEMMVEAYIDVMKRDVMELCRRIPHKDLVLQWDVNWETIAIEHGDHLPDVPPMQFKPAGDPMDRFARYVRELTGAVPEEVPVGLHLCYGDLHHRHFRDPDNLATSVAMFNRAVEVSGRTIDFVHMSVPRHRQDDEYFRPLRDLARTDATVYAGLVHYTDGVPGSLQRLEAFQRHYNGPTGVATECGLGRRPPDQELETLLAIHRDVAAGIA